MDHGNGFPGRVQLRSGLIAASLLASSALLAAPGDPLDPPTRPSAVAEHQQYALTVARATSGAYAALWYESSEDPAITGLYARAYAADGTPRGPAFLVDPSLQGRLGGGRIVMDAAGRFLVSWTTDRAIMGRHFADDGAPMGPALQLASRPPLGELLRDNYQLAMAPDGRYVLLLERTLDTSSPVRLLPVTITLQRFEADGRKRGLPILAATRLDYDLRLPFGLGPAIPPELRRQQLSRASSLALDAAGNIALAWISWEHNAYYPGDYGLGNGYGSLKAAVKLRRISAGGLPQGGVVLVDQLSAMTLSTAANYQVSPQVVREPDGDMVVAWQRPGAGLQARRYSRDGGAAGPAITVATAAQVMSDAAFDLAVAANGHSVLAWTAPRVPPLSSYENSRVRARIYDGSGTALTGPLAADDSADGGQVNPQLGIDADGGFVLAWHSLVQTGPVNYDNTGYLRRYAGQ